MASLREMKGSPRPSVANSIRFSSPFSAGIPAIFWNSSPSGRVATMRSGATSSLVAVRSTCRMKTSSLSTRM